MFYAALVVLVGALAIVGAVGKLIGWIVGDKRKKEEA